MNEYDIDRMKSIIKPIVENGIDIIENDMKSKYLGLIEVEKDG